MNNKTTPLQRKLLFRATHRGIKEMDIVLGSYTQVHIAGMSSQQLEVLSLVLALQDQPLFKAFSLPDEQEFIAAIAEKELACCGALAEPMRIMLRDIWHWIRLPIAQHLKQPFICHQEGGSAGDPNQ